MEVKDRAGSETERCLRQLGLCRNYRGIDYLTSAVEIVAKDPAVLSDGLVKKWLYPAVGREFCVSGDGVEACIRWTLGALWNRGNREALNRLAGRTLTRQPTNREFLMMMVEHLNGQKEPSEEP